LRELDSGAAQSQITIDNLKRYKVVLPDDAVLKKYNDITTQAYKEKSILESKNKNLACQRDMLLPRLMSGKLTV
jgi:type I restriction enzyme S subunit